MLSWNCITGRCNLFRAATSTRGTHSELLKPMELVGEFGRVGTRKDFLLTYDKLIVIILTYLLPPSSQKIICHKFNTTEISLAELRNWCAGKTKWTAGGIRAVNKKINSIKKGTNEGSEMKPPQAPQTPTQKASPSGRYEAAGPATGTTTTHTGMEICNRC